MKEVLVDSSLIVEYLKGNPRVVELLESLESDEYALYTTDVVFREVVYLLMGYYSGTSPKTIKGCPEKLPEELSIVFKVLKSFGSINVGHRAIFRAIELIQKYAMFPNDALIFAACIEHGFSLATLDEDFKLPAGKEGVPLIEG